ncbi:MAG: helix-turn-helix domain-containing protein [Candidatus Thermoplasmatota archaeon]|nr:helix-turn-helix domain-containing protein [Candidatus Thermoplasmatota archaeon]
MGYKRLQTVEGLLENRNRARIFEAVISYPGASFTELRNILDIKNGTLSHHLIKLEKKGLIASKKLGVFRRYYPANGDVPLDLEERIRAVILKDPGISQSSIARKLEITRQVANYHITSLKRKGMLVVKRQGRSSQIFMK